MQIQLRRAQSVRLGCSALLLVIFVAMPSWAAEKVRLRVDNYQIEAELTPHLHQIAARAKVKFTALQDLNTANFRTAQRDAGNQGSGRERPTAVGRAGDAGFDDPRAVARRADQGRFPLHSLSSTRARSRVPTTALSRAQAGLDWRRTSYLLYSGRWFPVSGYGLNRFTATISITVPAHMMVIGSGKSTVADNPPQKNPTATGCRRRHLRCIRQAEFSWHHRGGNFSGI